MKNHIKSFLFLQLSWCLLFIFSCSEYDEQISDPTAELDEAVLDYSDPVLKHILNLGFSESDIEDHGDEYIVDKDIAFSKDMQVNTVSKPGNNSGRLYQYYIGELVDFTRQRDIKVRINTSATDLTSEINAAIGIWNNVPNSNIHFRIVSNNFQDMEIRVEPVTGFCGFGAFPSSGRAGSTIRIDPNNIANLSFAQKVHLIAHELGHNIGFTHTDEGAGGGPISVPGMGGGDSNSIMNVGNGCSSSSTQLSTKDKGALVILYRDPRPTNTQIQITSSQFKVTWSNPTILANGANHISNEIHYGGFSGNNFGGVATVSASAGSFTILGADPYPSSNGTTGGISVTVKAKYSNATYSGSSATRNKNGGVWY
ncbi:MAG: M57 family metalloprotease [Cyclobacteriaceae bacterium]